MNIFEGDLLPMQVWTKRVEKRVDLWESGKPEGVSTGFKAIDPYLRLVGSEYTLIAGRPGMGKTSFGMQIVQNVERHLQKTRDPGIVCVFSAEMSGTELTIRMASALSGTNAHALRNGYGKPEEFVRFRESVRWLTDSSIWIDDSTGPTTKTMLSRLSEQNKITPVRMMLFDFVELGGDEGSTEENRISSIHKHLKGIAKKLDIPVVGLSQLNREVEKRADKMPQLEDLRGSGMGEQIADKVLFIMRPEYYINAQKSISEVPEEDRKGVAYCIIAKNRTGPTGVEKLAFISEQTKFADLARETPA